VLPVEGLLSLSLPAELVTAGRVEAAHRIIEMIFWCRSPLYWIYGSWICSNNFSNFLFIAVIRL